MQHYKIDQYDYDSSALVASWPMEPTTPAWLHDSSLWFSRHTVDETCYGRPMRVATNASMASWPVKSSTHPWINDRLLWSSLHTFDEACHGRPIICQQSPWLHDPSLCSSRHTLDGSFYDPALNTCLHKGVLPPPPWYYGPWNHQRVLGYMILRFAAHLVHTKKHFLVKEKRATSAFVVP